MTPSTLFLIEYKHAGPKTKEKWSNLGVFFEDKEDALRRVAKLAQMHGEDGWEFRTRVAVRG